MIKLIKINDKEKNFKSSQRKKDMFIQKDKDEGDIRFPTGNNARKATVVQAFKTLKGKICQSSILSLVKISFKNKGKLKTFQRYKS